MRTGSLPSVAADLLRQSLEHLAAPAIVVEDCDAPVIHLANAAARNCGMREQTEVLTALDRSLNLPAGVIAQIAASLGQGLPTTAQWTDPNGVPTTLRLSPLKIEGQDRAPFVLTWSTAATPASIPDAAHASARQELNDWLASTPVDHDSIDDVIQDLTERLVALYDVDRAAVWTFSPNEQELICRDLYDRAEQRHSRGEILKAADCSAEFETLKRSLFIDVHDVDRTQRVVGRRNSYLHRIGVTATLDAVIRFGGRCYGTLCLEHTAGARIWQPGEIGYACSIASYLATAYESLARSKAESAARKSEQFLTAVVDGSPIGIQVFAPDGSSLRLNPAMRKMLAATATDDADRPRSLIEAPLAEGPGIDSAFRQAVAGRVAHIERCSIPDGDRKRWLESVFYPVFDEAGAVASVVAFARDISKRVLAQQQREGLERQLRQAQKIEAIGRLAGGVAHDFNNLLTAVRGFSDMLLMELAPDHPHHFLVQQIRSAAERGASLTRQLAAFGRVQVTRIEVFDASNATIEMMPMLRRLLETNIQVELTANGPTPIRADRSQLQQILVNLLMNARDAMPEGGIIQVSIEAIHTDSGDAQMRLEVRDNGRGMDEETRQRVFDPFFTTKQLPGTSGLGLSTVYGIVTEAGGSIDIDSREGSGTTARILWPLATEQPSATSAAAPTRTVPTDATILVAEDDDANRLLVASALERLGYRVFAAENGEEALDVATRHPRIDLLLTDVVMPGIGGRLLAERLGHVHPNARVLYTSGHTSDDVLRQGIREEGVAYLPKPFSVDQLAQAVRASLDTTSKHAFDDKQSD